MRCVIFDLDGTLADTSGDLIAAANHCLAEMGAATRLDPARDAGTALRGGRAMLRLGLSRETGEADEAVIDQWYQPLLRAYEDNIAEHTVFYPGALDAVERLRSNGYAVGICTNKPEGLAEQLMHTLGARSLFHSLIGADTLPVRKPDPAPFWAAVEGAGGHRDAAMLVGDTETDRNTARAAGRPCLLVTFGPGGGDMAALDPEGLLSGYDRLDDAVAALIG
ncbi:HAD-IA family hydrolase [Cognatishimia sp. F0-27]|uniref:HAD-IA family hydrolase n=1 Tax=Cognatishimia sp. F0-27 TaxID=2816855 RepID=UPI001D0CC4D9|nr:HAD-IA family hydrolase [Cognatishimia sp. F0-27]MCC1494385.1 HAD-IA family hydrolase [Cognatishimia sp. F0-27]